MYPTDWSTLSPFEPAICSTVRRCLKTFNITEVQAVALIPVTKRTILIQGKHHDVQLRYPFRTALVDKNDHIYLRTHGTDFNIVPPEWIRDGLGRVYSLGPGFDEHFNEHLLLLVQCFSPTDELLKIQAAIVQMGFEVESLQLAEYDQACWRLSALFRSVTFP